MGGCALCREGKGNPAAGALPRDPSAARTNFSQSTMVPIQSVSPGGGVAQTQPKLSGVYTIQSANFKFQGSFLGAADKACGRHKPASYFALFHDGVSRHAPSDDQLGMKWELNEVRPGVYTIKCAAGVMAGKFLYAGTDEKVDRKSSTASYANVHGIDKKSTGGPEAGIQNAGQWQITLTLDGTCIIKSVNGEANRFLSAYYYAPDRDDKRSVGPAGAKQQSGSYALLHTTYVGLWKLEPVVDQQ